jgi:hypothetical protein
MTEQEWDSCTNPQKMLEFLRGKAGDRKLRLFACGCCRRVWDRLTNPRSRAAVEVAERYADGQATEAERDEAERQAEDAHSEVWRWPPMDADREAWWGALVWAYVATTRDLVSEREVNAAPLSAAVSPGAQVALLRDIVGNPYRPQRAAQAWLTWNGGTVRKLAQSIYDERQFSDMPILADALEEAGCDNAEVLQHLRSPGPHVRGCHVLDLILGRE